MTRTHGDSPSRIYDEPALARALAVLQHRRRIAVAVALAIAGVVAIIAGWFGVSGTRVISDQLSYLASGTAVGLCLVAIAGALLMTDYVAEQQRQYAELRAVLDELRQRIEFDSPSRASKSAGRRPSAGSVRGVMATAKPERDAPSNGRLVRVVGAQRVHMPDCLLVHGKRDLQVLDPEAALAEGLLACRTCGPPLPPVAKRTG